MKIQLRTQLFLSLSIGLILNGFGAVVTPAYAAPIEVAVVAERLRAADPAGSFAMPVSGLQYSPEVDIQSRNSAEGQGDLTIRGGTFESSGVEVGGIAVLDPQTGHYATELPIDPEMLSAPELRTGYEHALTGFNATAGALRYSWRAIEEDSSLLRAGFGDYRSFAVSGYQSVHNLFGTNAADTVVNLDASLARSDADGAVFDEELRASRGGLRLQAVSSHSQSDLSFGRQNKFVQWPYLYAPRGLHNLVGSPGNESDSTHTTLVNFNHRYEYGAGSTVEFAAYHRKLDDNYEFDVTRQGLFNRYEHTTRARAAALSGLHQEGALALRYGAQIYGDDIDSTALTFGNYSSKRMYRGVLVPEYAFKLDDGKTLTVGAGAGIDDSNRDSSRVTPQGSLSLSQQQADGSVARYYGEIAQISQLAGYTALNSNPAGGLFRGDADLGRSLSTNYEVGYEHQAARYYKIAGFVRTDEDLVDWTYNTSAPAFAARFANNVDIRTYGVELLGRQQFSRGEISFGYTYLDKNEDYGDAVVDASFYALNYARHRIAGSAVYRVTDDLSLRFDTELRRQRANTLRSSDGTGYALGALSVVAAVPCVPEAEVVAAIDNLWNESFEEVPGVPAAKRTFLAGVRVRF